MDPVEVRRRNLIAKFDDPHTTVIGQTYDIGDFGGGARPGAGRGRLRRAAGRAEAAPGGGRSGAARHRCELLRGDHRRRATVRRRRPHRRPPRRPGRRPHRHVAARPGPRHRVVDDRIVGDRHPDRGHRRRLGRHRPRPGRWRHDGVPLAAAGRRRRPGRGHRTGGAGARTSPPSSSRPTLPTSCSTSTAARSTWPAPRPSPSPGPRWRRPGGEGRHHGAHHVHRVRARRSRSAPTWPWSKSTPRPAE